MNSMAWSSSSSSRHTFSRLYAEPNHDPTTHEVELKSYIGEMKASDTFAEQGQHGVDEERATDDVEALADGVPAVEVDNGGGASSTVPLWALAPGWEELGGNFM